MKKILSFILIVSLFGMGCSKSDTNEPEHTEVVYTKCHWSTELEDETLCVSKSCVSQLLDGYPSLSFYEPVCLPTNGIRSDKGLATLAKKIITQYEKYLTKRKRESKEKTRQQNYINNLLNKN